MGSAPFYAMTFLSKSKEGISMQNWTKATAILVGIVLLVVLGLAAGGGIMPVSYTHLS